MLRPTAKRVEIPELYKILIYFDNGEKKIFDVKPYIKGEWYSALQSESYFKSAFADGFTVAWPDGQDLDPDELYEGG